MAVRNVLKTKNVIRIFLFSRKKKKKNNTNKKCVDGKRKSICGDFVLKIKKTKEDKSFEKTVIGGGFGWK